MLAATVGTVLAFPFGAAATCPTCYGLDPFGENIFIDRAASDEQRRHVMTVIRQARERVAAFYGETDARPRILVCVTDECYARIRSAGSRGNAILDLALQLSPGGIDPVIAAHELSHIELHHRLGPIQQLIGGVPAWFDEGVAVVVSDDRRYLKPATAPDRCRVRSDEALPTGSLEWRREMGASDPRGLYAKSACRVADWMSANGGAAGVLWLIERVSHRTPFAEAYATGG